MPTPPTDDEVIYANEEELQSMIDSSVASEVSPAHGVKSPPALVKTAITQRVNIFIMYVVHICTQNLFFPNM